MDRVIRIFTVLSWCWWESRVNISPYSLPRLLSTINNSQSTLSYSEFRILDFVFRIVSAVKVRVCVRGTFSVWNCEDFMYVYFSRVYQVLTEGGWTRNFNGEELLVAVWTWTSIRIRIPTPRCVFHIVWWSEGRELRIGGYQHEPRTTTTKLRTTQNV